MTKLFFAAFALLLCIGAVQATTVSGSKYSTVLSVGSSDNFSMGLKPDTAGEIGMPLTVGMDDGNCSKWVTPDTKGFALTTTGTTVKAAIKVPSTAYNGNYSCNVWYTAPASGMTTMRIAVPIKVTVTGGREAPIATEAPTAAPEAPTEKVTAVQTQATPVLMPVTTATTSTTLQAPEGEGFMPDVSYLPIVITVMIMFLVVLAYDLRRGKK